MGIYTDFNDIKVIAKELENLSSPKEYDKVTQMHPNHRAVEAESSYSYLGKDRFVQISLEFYEWLKRYNYL